VAASCFVHVPVAAAEEPAATRRPVRLSPTLVTVFAIVALEFSLSFWLASFLTDDVGLGRGFAAAVVSLLYAANLVGRVAISRLARTLATDRLLAGALALGLVGVVVLLSATASAVALVGIAIAGVGIGATFPLIASLHVADNVRRADAAFGEVLTVAAFGQVLGPLAVALVAQAAGLRAGLVLLPALTLLGLGALARRGL
jgi:fucose permease